MTTINPASRGLEINEPLIFDRSAKNITGVDFFAEDSIEQEISVEDIARAQKTHERKNTDPLTIPDLSEPEAVRHFTRLSKKNCSIDTQAYPLGSCTMKYNPKIHEWAGRLAGFSSLHPYMPEEDLQSALKIYYQLQTYLSEIGGFYRTSLAPSAGAQGEFAGIAMILKALKARGQNRRKILVPKSAHGTNPATAAFFSLDVEPLDMDIYGRIDIREVERKMTADCAGLMVTNPNTLGIFESNLKNIADLIHERGGFVYGDGANLNALMGIARPGDFGVDVMHFNLHKTMTTPHGGGGPGCGAIGAVKELAPFLPSPFVKENKGRYEIVSFSETSIGRIRSFLGNFAMIVRAWVYVRSLGAQGLREASEYAVLNANYVREKLRPYYHLPYDADCLHEVVMTDKWQQQNQVSTLDIAKRLMDYGIHPPTMYFPLVVKGALMIEPTETESLFDLEKTIEAFITVAKEAKENPDLVKAAPHNTALSRLDEAQAARNPILVYEPR